MDSCTQFWQVRLCVNVCVSATHVPTINTWRGNIFRRFLGDVSRDSTFFKAEKTSGRRLSARARWEPSILRS